MFELIGKEMVGGVSKSEYDLIMSRWRSPGIDTTGYDRLAGAFAQDDPDAMFTTHPAMVTELNNHYGVITYY